MKKVILSFVLCVLAGNIFAQTPAYLGAYSVNLDETILSSTEMIGDMDENIKAAVRGEDLLTKFVSDTFYTVINKRLTEETDLRLSAIEAMKGKLKYDVYGYPNGSIKKITKAVGEAQGVKILVTVLTASSSAKTLSGEVTYTDIKIRPDMRLALTLIDKNGEGKKYVGKAKTPKNQRIEAESAEVWGITMTEGAALESVGAALCDLLNAALDDLITQINADK